MSMYEVRHSDLEVAEREIEEFSQLPSLKNKIFYVVRALGSFWIDTEHNSDDELFSVWKNGERLLI